MLLKSFLCPRVFLALLFVVAVFIAAPVDANETGAGDPDTPMKKALIFWGGWDGHEPQRCTQIVKAILEEEGFFVHVEEGTAFLANPIAEDIDLIIPNITMGQISGQELSSIKAAVENGVGLAGWHGGAGDSFHDSTGYHFMIGGQFVTHPGDKHEYTVNITRPDDPIMAGLSDFKYTSELYYMHVDPSNEVLATSTFTGAVHSWIDGVVMPVVWKRAYGKGRVFYSSMGHSPAEFEHHEMRTILRRGLVWAAR